MTTMKLRTTWTAGALALALVGGAPGVAAQTQSLEAIAWLEGRWVGSGGGYDAFYESFTLQGSVLRQLEHPDSTFTTAGSVSEWRLSEGRIVKFSDDGTAVSEIAAIVGDSIRIERLSSDGPGYSWVRNGPDEWVAILERRSGEPVRYVMRRYDGG